MITSEETLSSNTLFHITSSRQSLEKIIENGFIPHYSREDLSLFGLGLDEQGQRHDISIPMVCFCDIPLSKIKDHLKVYGSDDYGRYGIGCSKEWGIARKVTPLIYVEELSETTVRLNEIIRGMTSAKSEILSMGYEDIVHSIYESQRAFWRVVQFTKKYKGDFLHHGVLHPNKRFYDEREWRFIPELNDINLPAWIELDKIQQEIIAYKDYYFGKKETINWHTDFSHLTGHLEGVNEVTFDLKKATEKIYRDSRERIQSQLIQKIKEIELNKDLPELKETKISKLKLPIDPLSIKYIIVENDNDIVPILEKLEKRFLDDYSGATLKRLFTRIVTIDQITQDF